jgi:histidine triad (HIT) family protein
MANASEYEGEDFYCGVALAHPELLEVVHETKHVLAFRHTRPSYPTHIVVIPKRHITSLTAATEADEPVMRKLLLVVRDMASRVETSQGAARVVTNVGRYQESKHLHVHIVSGARREISSRGRR